MENKSLSSLNTLIGSMFILEISTSKELLLHPTRKEIITK